MRPLRSGFLRPDSQYDLEHRVQPRAALGNSHLLPESGPMNETVSGEVADVRFGGLIHERSRDDWCTPPALKRKIYEKFTLDFDPCPYPKPEWDGLKVPWRGRAFVNPPYGGQTPRWFEKAIRELTEGRIEIAVFLVHSRTDARWFHEVMDYGGELYFLPGRVKFELPGSPRGGQSAFPSVIIALHPRPTPLTVRAWV